MPNDNGLITAIEEGIAALYGARGVCGDIGNISHAIELLEYQLRLMGGCE